MSHFSLRRRRRECSRLTQSCDNLLSSQSSCLLSVRSSSSSSSMLDMRSSYKVKWSHKHQAHMVLSSGKWFKMSQRKNSVCVLSVHRNSAQLFVEHVNKFKFFSDMSDSSCALDESDASSSSNYAVLVMHLSEMSNFNCMHRYLRTIVGLSFNSLEYTL